MKVLVVEPMKKPYTKEIDGSLESMQELVGGTIEVVYPFDDPVALICNDEGKLMGLTPNRLLKDSQGEPYDMVCGTFFLTGLGEEDFQSLSPELTVKYNALYRREWLIVLPKEPPGKGPRQNTPERLERS